MFNRTSVNCFRLFHRQDRAPIGHSRARKRPHKIYAHTVTIIITEYLLNVSEKRVFVRVYFIV